jgi:HlyD family secretion protein
VAQARSALDEARDRLSKTVIRAPMDGVITRLNVEEGSTAIVGTMNNPGSLLLTWPTCPAWRRWSASTRRTCRTSRSATAHHHHRRVPRQKFTGRVTEIGYSSVRSPLQQRGADAGRPGHRLRDRDHAGRIRRPRCAPTCPSRPTS